MLSRKTKRSGSHSNNKKVLLVLLVALVVLAAGFYAFNKTRSNENSSQPNDSGIDFSPATDEEKQDSNRHKEEIISDAEKAKNIDNTQKISVQPVIVDASQYGDIVEVRSYVSGVIEDNGICRASFSKDNVSLVRESKGSKDATTTRCTKLSINKSEFPTTGKWSLTIEYLSPAATGKSQPTTVEVK